MTPGTAQSQSAPAQTSAAKTAGAQASRPRSAKGAGTKHDSPGENAFLEVLEARQTRKSKSSEARKSPRDEESPRALAEKRAKLPAAERLRKKRAPGSTTDADLAIALPLGGAMAIPAEVMSLPELDTALSGRKSLPASATLHLSGRKAHRASVAQGRQKIAVVDLRRPRGDEQRTMKGPDAGKESMGRSGKNRGSETDLVGSERSSGRSSGARSGSGRRGSAAASGVMDAAAGAAAGAQQREGGQTDPVLRTSTTQLDPDSPAAGASARSAILSESPGDRTPATTATVPRFAETLQNEVVRHATVLIRSGDQGEIRLVLKPESLGSVRIRMQMTQNSVEGRIVVENASVRQIVEESLESLRQAIRQTGYETASLKVSVGGGGADSGRRGDARADGATGQAVRAVELFESGAREVVVNGIHHQIDLIA